MRRVVHVSLPLAALRAAQRHCGRASQYHDRHEQTDSRRDAKDARRDARDPHGGVTYRATARVTQSRFDELHAKVDGADETIDEVKIGVERVKLELNRVKIGVDAVKTDARTQCASE